MSISLPPVGTNALLQQLSGYIPDNYIDEVLSRGFTGGRRHQLSAVQLWRTHLLPVLTKTHSINLLLARLPEQAQWRRFAGIRRSLPTARMLHEFREQVGVSGLRKINRYILRRMLHRQGLQPYAVALMDSTDLPAACNGFKKKFLYLHCCKSSSGSANS